MPPVPAAGIPNIRDTVVYQMMKNRNLPSYKAYVKTFEEFCQKHKITVDSPPTLEHVEVH